ncbi:hypothetical protein BDB01DRAFT_843006 [Pilobolus umbonatus]|nr:hypothetical protein BDB01DRAFT_843006 [Pilobolus umbonatus]
MDTVPSKRELQHFLKRFGSEEKTTHPSLLSGFEVIKGAPGVQSPKDYVNALLGPSFNQLAITKIEGPFEKSEWASVGNTLYKLQKLGLTSIVVSDNPNWQNDKSSAIELNKRMIRESMTLVESIEKAGGRARLVYGGVIERSNVASKSIDINLDFVHYGLSHNQIPIVVPILTDTDGLQVPITANEAMTALTNKLAKQRLNPRLVPSKIVVINKEGGIPNHERPGTAHSLVNIQEEYKDIQAAFSKNHQWNQSYPNTMENLSAIRHCLNDLPISSSAIIVPVSSLPNALIANLVTDKPLFSSSLPITDKTRINQAKTTVLRHGIEINSFQRLDEIDVNRLSSLLEASFGKVVDRDGFYKRLENVMASVIVAGDYEGAVVMTNEKVAEDSRSHAYLDKFAIAPSSQGIGLTDILWRKMCDGYPELFWRSRKDNGVNKWYFERCNGYLRLKDSNWVLFWHGKNGYQHIQEYAKIADFIPASFINK